MRVSEQTFPGGIVCSYCDIPFVDGQVVWGVPIDAEVAAMSGWSVPSIPGLRVTMMTCENCAKTLKAAFTP